MTLSIELPPPVDRELEVEAARDGVTASEQATLLLLLAMALTGGGRNSPFRGAVRRFLEQNSLDADHLADVCEGLIDLCRRDDPVLLRGWRSPDAHRPIGSDAEIEIGRIDFPPLEELIQHSRRKKVASVMGKYAHLGGGTEEFMREKQAEIEREDRR